MAGKGMTLLVPSAVSVTGGGSSATIGANGKITYSSAVTLQIDGVFSATYDNYLMVAVTTIGTAKNVYLRYRASGVTATASNYAYQQLSAFASTVSGFRATGEPQTLVVGVGDGVNNGFHAYFYGPALSQSTIGRGISAQAVAAGAQINEFAFVHTVSSAYDGIDLNFQVAASGTMTIYGLNQ